MIVDLTENDVLHEKLQHKLIYCILNQIKESLVSYKLDMLNNRDFIFDLTFGILNVLDGNRFNDKNFVELDNQIVPLLLFLNISNKQVISLKGYNTTYLHELLSNCLKEEKELSLLEIVDKQVDDQEQFKSILKAIENFENFRKKR